MKHRLIPLLLALALLTGCASPLIPSDIPVSGAIYDVRTGKVHEVVRA